MTGKEALEELKFQVGSITAYTHDLQATTFKVRDSGLFEIIEKDLNEYEQHKDFEKDLGIDLITLVKAFIYGVYSKHEKYKIDDVMLGKCDDEYFLYVKEKIGTYRMIGYIKDYGKTWALTKEELKNERHRKR